MKGRFLILLCMCLLISCQDQKEKEYNRILEELNLDLSNISNIVIIPNEGCGGCITDATIFFQENFLSFRDSTVIIFTGVRDLKQLQLTVGSKLLDEKNVFIDSKNLFLNDKVSSIYPQRLNIKNSNTSAYSLFERSNF